MSESVWSFMERVLWRVTPSFLKLVTLSLPSVVGGRIADRPLQKIISLVLALFRTKLLSAAPRLYVINFILNFVVIFQSRDQVHVIGKFMHCKCFFSFWMQVWLCDGIRCWTNSGSLNYTGIDAFHPRYRSFELCYVASVLKVRNDPVVYTVFQIQHRILFQKCFMSNTVESLAKVKRQQDRSPSSLM